MKYSVVFSRIIVCLGLVVVGNSTLQADDAKKIETALDAWAKHAESMKLVDCEFTRWEYAPLGGVVGANGQAPAECISTGNVAIRPKGSWEFEVDEIRLFNRASGKYDKARRGGEHWLFDGRDMWEISTTLKTITQMPTDMALLGMRVDTFVRPFRLALLGDEADAVRREYYVKDVTPAAFAGNELWLQLAPRDAAVRRLYSNFDIVLTLPDMTPHAIRMVSAGGGSVSTIEFRKLKYNNVFAAAIKRPEVPKGWKVNLIEAESKSEEVVSEKAETAINPSVAATPPHAETPRQRRRLLGFVRRMCGRR